MAHHWTTLLAVPTLGALGIVELLRRRWAGVANAAGLLLVTCAGWVSGYLLPYEELAFYATSTPGRFSGYWVLFHPEVRFAVAEGRQYRREDLVRLLLAHSLGLTAAVAVFLVATLSAQGRERHPRGLAQDD